MYTRPPVTRERIRRRPLRQGTAFPMPGVPAASGTFLRREKAPLRHWVINPESSEVVYRVGEAFFGNIPRGVAVGMTRGIEGVLTLHPDAPARLWAGLIRVDIRQFTSDEPRRDARIRREWLESDRYPIAELRVTEVRGVPAGYRPGDLADVQVHGYLTLRETTRPVSWEGILVLGERELRAALETYIRMTDFGFEPPAVAGLLKAENDVHLVFNFVAEPEV